MFLPSSAGFAISWLILAALMLVESTSADINTFTDYTKDYATSMYVDSEAQIILFGMASKTIKIMNSTTATTISDIQTAHKSPISIVSMNRQLTIALTGGSDSMVFLIDVATGSTLCSWADIRGEVISSSFFPFSATVTFATLEGYLYDGRIWDCKLNKVQLNLGMINGVCGINLNGLYVWLSTYKNVIYSFSVSFRTISTIVTLPTSKIQSIFYFPYSTLTGVCTQTAFYILD